jgi:hypothetical protein
MAAPYRNGRQRAREALLACSLALVSLPAPAAPLSDSPDIFPEDSRLNRPVTVLRGRVYLGELVRDLSRQARLSLSVEDAKGPSSGIGLTVFVHERPLREVMDGLASLLAHRFNTWEWQRKASGYVLRHQHAPGEAYETARKEILGRWADDVRRYHRIAKLPPGERAAEAERIPHLFPEGMLRGGMPDLMAELGNPQMDALLRGNEVPLDVNRLGSAARAALSLGQTGGAPVGEVRMVAPALYVTWDASFIGPILWLRNERGAAGNVVGGPGWEKQWLRSEGGGWRHRGDPDVDAQLEAAGRRRPEAGAPSGERTLAEWVKKAAMQHRLNLMADLVYPRAGQSIGYAWIGRTPEQTLLTLAARSGLGWKRRGPIDLLRDKTASIHPRRHLVLWKDIERLREAGDRGAGYLGLEELQFLAELSHDQLAGLSEEFPDANTDIILEWRPILRFYANLSQPARERASRPNGLPLRDAGLIARAALTEGVDARGIRGLGLLREHAHVAVVALYHEAPRKQEAVRGQERVQTERRPLVWRVSVPGIKEHRYVFRQQPRQPLKPD